MKTHIFLTLAGTLSATAAPVRTSASYSLHAENPAASLTVMSAGSIMAVTTADGGGTASRGSTATTAAGTGLTARFGTAGQIFDAASVAVSSQPAPIPETSAAQLTAAITLDDGTAASGFAAAARWAHLSGPLVTVTPAGLATAGIVSADTPAAVRVSVAGVQRTASVTVRDSLPDNFGPLAGDGLPDAWQLAHFDNDHDGTPDLPFAPGDDADSDGTDNGFEWRAGTRPADAASRFEVIAESQPGGVLRLRFGPVYATRRYPVLKRSDLTAQPEKIQSLEPAADAPWAETDIPADPALRMFYSIEPQEE